MFGKSLDSILPSRYRDTEIQIIRDEYRDTDEMRGFWGPSEHTQRLWAVCLGAFAFWGLMHAVWWLQRYRWFPDCPSVEVRIWWDHSPGYLFGDNFWYSVIDIISIMISLILCRFIQYSYFSEWFELNMFI